MGPSQVWRSLSIFLVDGATRPLHFGERTFNFGRTMLG